MKKKLKIAIIDMDDLKSTHWGAGQARATREVFKRLSAEYDITVYCSKYPGYQDYIEDGITYTHIGISNKSARLTNIFFIAAIPWLVATLDADLIIENFNAPISSSFVPCFTRIPVIGIPTMFNAQEFTKKYHLPFHWIEAAGLKFYRYMVAYSDIDSAKIKRLNSKICVRIIPQGVGDEYFAIQRKQSRFILFLGRYDIWQKGIDLLLRAYATVKDTITFPLIVAGKGHDEAQIINLIHELKLEDRVTVTGPAYEKRKYELLSEAVFVAFPSRHDELSLWSLEALASGCPLVMFDLPECKWVSKKAAIKSKPFDIESYGKALLSATQPDVQKAMSDEARSSTRQYTWERAAQMYRQFINDVLHHTI